MTTSPALTAATPVKTATDAAGTVASEVRYGARFLHGHGWRVLLVFLGLLAPLLVFAGMVGELQEKETFFFDQPVMLALHQMASPGIDAFFVFISKLGYQWGVIPVDVGVLGWLIVRRRHRDGLFFGLAVVGSLLLNLMAKNQFGRIRPDLWITLAPETTYSFPSGHAMGSVTLGVALILLFWASRWRWWVFVAASVFVVLVGLSRIYLGVHYPSDILAGWMAGTAWVIAMYQLVAGRAPPPPSTPTGPPGKDSIVAAKVRSEAKAAT